MSRLRYSSNGIVRAIEMSRGNVIALVEGFIDRAFYGEVLALTNETKGLEIVIRQAHEIEPSLGSGKLALLGVHNLLRKKKKLVQGVGTRRKAVVVFLDKDVDNFKRICRRCRHVIYTEHYSVENYLFKHGDIESALVVGACLDRTSAVSCSTGKNWAENAARHWLEWVAFCLMVSRDGSLGLPNFAVRSLIHDGEYGVFDSTRLQTLLNSVARKSGVPSSEVRIQFEKHQKQVNRLFLRGEIDQVFNGKWYTGFLVKDAERIARGRNLPIHLGGRLETALLGSLDFNGAWLNYFRSRISKIFDVTGAGSRS